MAAHDGGDDNSGPGSSSSGREEENEVENEVAVEDRACGTDALKQGTTVKEAEAKLTSNGLVLGEIELA
jgi:hypothetical protein